MHLSERIKPCYVSVCIFRLSELLNINIECILSWLVFHKVCSLVVPNAQCCRLCDPDVQMSFQNNFFSSVKLLPSSASFPASSCRLPSPFLFVPCKFYAPIAFSPHKSISLPELVDDTCITSNPCLPNASLFTIYQCFGCDSAS